ncbi:MAG: large repetitive protein [Thermoleophilaceae bacterium]|nr:large repetitive protein [Thermoleophilaceae bacterium]
MVPRIARLLQLAPLAAAIALSSAAAATALPPECETDCPDPGGGEVVTTVTPELTVSRTSGTIRDSPLANIDCGADCFQGGSTYSYTSTCDGGACTYQNVDTVTLVALGGPPGFSPHWTLCAADSTGACKNLTRFPCDSSTSGNCGVQMYDDTRVELTWDDTTDPNTSFSSEPAVVGPAVRTFTASATDNSGSVPRVRFRIDGGVGTDDTSAPFQFSVDPSLYTDGSTHTITAQAFDPADRGDASPDAATFTVDRSTQVSITSPADGAHSESAPAFSFTIEGGASATCTTLAGASGETSLGQSPCTSSYTPAATAPGEYRVRIASTDAVGNTATVMRGFVIDAPTQTGGTGNTGGTGDTGGTGNTGGGGSTGGGDTGITSAAILDALGLDVAAAARKLAGQKQRTLVKARGQGLKVKALTAGTFTLVFSGQTTKAKASRSVAIAKGRKVATGAGAYTLSLKLTKAGARLLRKGKQVRGKLTLSFTGTGQSKLSRSRTVTLKRR